MASTHQDRPAVAWVSARVSAVILAAVVAGILTASATSAASPAVASYRLDADYEVSLYLAWRTRWVRVRTAIDLRNSSGSGIDEVHLNTVAARLGSMRRLVVEVDGDVVPAVKAGQTIKVPLPAPLADGDRASVKVSFRARLRTTNQKRDFLWSRRNGVAQMYRFIPWVSRLIPFGSTGHGEPFLTPNSENVTVTVDSGRRLVWAASGQRVGKDGRRITFRAHNVRDFALTASPGYRTVSGLSKDGRTRIFAHTRSIDGRRLVRLARTELARYRSITGVAYPHPTYRIAETSSGLAMESPGLIWIPASRSAADHPFLISHETAHQWFYGIVGNDQSTDAFADEALADYFARKAHLSLRQSRCHRDRLDRDIRGYSSVCYYEVIYIQGARFLDRLRKDYGGVKFLRAIRAYVHDYRLDIASNRKLLEAFRAEMGNGVLPRYRRRFPSIY